MFDFPNAPALNQTIVGPGGVSYMWDGGKWIAQAQAQTFQQPFDSTMNAGRNKLHNGLFNVQQRGAGPWTAAGYTADRWAMSTTLDTISFSMFALTDAGRAAIGDEAAVYAISNIFTGNAGATAANLLVQRIEDVRRLANKTVIISFWATAGAAGLKLGLNINQAFGSGGSPSASVLVLATGLSFTLSTTWTRYSAIIAIPSVAGKTLGTNNDHCTILQFYYSSGANANAQAGNIGVQSGTIWLWGCQLEIAAAGQTQPTPLEKLDPQTDLANCQRFYQVGSGQIAGYNTAASPNAIIFPLPVTMRAVPTMTVASTITSTNVSGPTNNPIDAGSYQLNAPATSTGNYNWRITWTASADL